jgi:hypothetical protein
VAFEPNQAFSLLIHDGPVEMTGRVIFEAINDNQTKLTTFIEIPGMDESMDTTFLISELEKAGKIRKQLIESET